MHVRVMINRTRIKGGTLCDPKRNVGVFNGSLPKRYRSGSNGQLRDSSSPETFLYHVQSLGVARNQHADLVSQCGERGGQAGGYIGQAAAFYQRVGLTAGREYFVPLCLVAYVGLRNGA